VTVYENGPLLLRGSFTITDQDGEPIPAGRRTVALCRCGRSALKPFCDGSHVRNKFRAAGRAEGMRRAAEQPGEAPLPVVSPDQFGRGGQPQ
jgi:CDGSH-type Zn-finger protein